MSCYHPLKGFVLGKNKNNKNDLKITSYNIERIVINNNNKLECLEQGQYPLHGVKREITDFVTIPCGRCIGCRLDYARRWADRCLLEAESHKNNLFVTLTYDEKNKIMLDKADGLYYYSLKKKDLQDFWKRLRKNYPEWLDDDFKYLACGEYGDQSKRPHYHAILFGCAIPDLRFYRKSKDGFNLFTSELLQGVWKHGFVIVGDFSFRSASYVSRYITKKMYGEAGSFYQKFGLIPPFICMSTKPAIGKKYFDLNKDKFLEYNSVFVPTDDGAKEITMPRYFKKLLEKSDPDLVREMMIWRSELAQNLLELRNESTSQDVMEMLATEESVKIAKSKILKRGDV